MSDFGTMKTRIANEMERSDLLSGGFISNAIQDAIKLHEQRRFWFNESRDLTFNTVAAQRIYTASDAAWIASILTIDELFVTVGGQNRCLRRREAAEIELMADNAALVGEPYSWAYWDNSIQLYPIPQQAYTVRAYGHIRLAALSEDSDTNAWMTDGERLIRQSAKALICSDVTFDGEGANRYGGLAEIALGALEEETGRRQSTGCVKATQF
jgi:hypothetical protein